jgi:hypothetical protein
MWMINNNYKNNRILYQLMFISSAIPDGLWSFIHLSLTISLQDKYYECQHFQVKIQSLRVVS